MKLQWKSNRVNTELFLHVNAVDINAVNMVDVNAYRSLIITKIKIQMQKSSCGRLNNAFRSADPCARVTKWSVQICTAPLQVSWNALLTLEFAKNCSSICICPNCNMYLSQQQNVFVPIRIFKKQFGRLYLSKLQYVFVPSVKYIFPPQVSWVQFERWNLRKPVLSADDPAKAVSRRPLDEKEKASCILIIFILLLSLQGQTWSWIAHLQSPGTWMRSSICYLDHVVVIWSDCGPEPWAEWKYKSCFWINSGSS